MALFATVIARTGHADTIRARLRPYGTAPTGEAATEEEARAIATEGFERDALLLDLDFDADCVDAYEITEGEEVIGWSVDY